MDALTQMKMRLQPVAGYVQAQVGDAFSLDNLAQLMINAERIDATTPQLQAALDYAKFIPVKSNFGGVLGTSHNLQRKQAVGRGKPFAGTGMDIPLAEVVYDEVSLATKAGSIGYQYSLMEVATALAMGMQLDNDKQAAARLAFERHMSDVAWFGEPETGLRGFYNQTGVALSNQTIDFATAPVAALLDFINTVIADAQDASEYDSSIAMTTIILPTNVSRALASRTTGADAAKPLLAYIRENNEAALEGRSIEITSSRRGNGRGETGADRVVAYCKDPNCIEMRIPQDLRFEPAQAKGLDMFVPGSYLYQGVWLKRVDSMRYYDVKK